MIDSFVLLTPIIMIGVVSLVVFVGCDIVFGLERVDFPFGLKATTRSQRVDLTWSATTEAKEYKLYRHQGAAAPVLLKNVNPPMTSHTDTDNLVDGMEYLYQIALVNGDGDESPKSVPAVAATPNPVNFVQTLTLTTARNDFTGFVGMGFQVGLEDLDIVQLGRPFGLGNTQTHEIKIIDAATKAELGSVMLDTNQLPRSIGQVQYTPLPQRVTLTAGGTYYILSAEISGGDQFYRHDATVTTTDVATVLGAYFEQPAGTFNQDMQAPMIYPVDFRY